MIVGKLYYKARLRRILLYNHDLQDILRHAPLNPKILTITKLLRRYVGYS